MGPSAAARAGLLMPSPAPKDGDQGALQRLDERLLSDWHAAYGRRQADGPTLLLFNPEAPAPDSGVSRDDKPRLDLRLADGHGAQLAYWNRRAVIETDSRMLPFQNAAMGAVLLCHVLRRDEDALLAEACRILQPDGSLLVLGLNRFGLRYLGGGSTASLPGISPLAVRDQLEALDMEVVTMFATGFLGRDKPRQMHRGAARVLAPLADVFLVLAKPVEPEIMNPIAPSRVRAVGVPSALAGS